MWLIGLAIESNVVITGVLFQSEYASNKKRAAATNEITTAINWKSTEIFTQIMLQKLENKTKKAKKFKNTIIRNYSIIIDSKPTQKSRLI